MPTHIAIENAKVSCRDIYMRLWANRDFEISHVWQRAIFLTAFLIACFAGYGGLLLAVITPGKNIVAPSLANGVAFAIAFVGLIVSLLWIMMAKGSKMWYENYECAIEAFRKAYPEEAFDLNGGVANVAGMELSDIRNYTPPPLSDWMWSTKGGNFSVSRINIFIGQLSSLIWGALLVVHIGIAKVGSLHAIEWVRTLLTNWVVMFSGGGILLLLFWLYAHFSMKGGRE